MRRLGRLTAIIGALMVALGLVVGFTAMIKGADTFAGPFLAVIPVGFLMLFAGVTTALLGKSGKTG